ncbi:IS3 family transposase, partial [Mycobacterium avium]|uniref:IS3 family transposase n=1 Tax=Mycobacterium avium TaxID=1764 RepID=UPI001CE195DC
GKFLRGGARPPTSQIVAFVDEHREEFGVEPICTVLRSAGVSMAPSTYYDAKTRPPSARALRHAVLGPVLKALWEDNYRVYGARKLWKAARRAGYDVGRDQVARLMRAAGIEGVRRGTRVKTTRADPAADRHPDLVGRDFTAAAPNELWVTDLTFVPTWAGVAYVCFITDAYSRMIVGWRVASHMRTTMVLDALEMARWSRGIILEGLRCHSDAGSQFTSLRYGERLAEIGAVPSIGSVGDSFDNALAETVNGYYKTELIYGPARSGPWKTVEDVELATLGWVHWHNTSRLHGYLGDLPPAEFEAAFYDAQRSDQPLVEIQ